MEKTTLVYIISDTHGPLPADAIAHLQQANEIWHAGDIGHEGVIDQLSQWATFRGVWGNIDDANIRARLPEYSFFEVAGLPVLLIHIAGAVGRYNPKVKSLLARHKPLWLVCGHSHILKVGPDKRFGRLTYLNPGALGHKGFHKYRTMLRAQIANGKVVKLEAIELGKRGTDTTQSI